MIEFWSQTLESIVTKWDPTLLGHHMELDQLPEAFRSLSDWACYQLPYILEEQRAHLWGEVAKHVDYYGPGYGHPGDFHAKASLLQWRRLREPVADLARGGWDDPARSWTVNLKFDLHGPLQIKRKDVVLLTNNPEDEHAVLALGVVRGMPNPSETYTRWKKPGQRAPFAIALYAPCGGPLAEALKTSLSSGDHDDDYDKTGGGDCGDDGSGSHWYIAYVGSIAPYGRMYDRLQSWALMDEAVLPSSPLTKLLLGVSKTSAAEEAAAAAAEEGGDELTAGWALEAAAAQGLEDGGAGARTGAAAEAAADAGPALQAVHLWTMGGTAEYTQGNPVYVAGDHKMATAAAASAPAVAIPAAVFSGRGLLQHERRMINVLKSAVHEYCTVVLRSAASYDTVVKVALAQAGLSGLDGDGGDGLEVQAPPRLLPDGQLQHPAAAGDNCAVKNNKGGPNGSGGLGSDRACGCSGVGHGGAATAGGGDPAQALGGNCNAGGGGAEIILLHGPQLQQQRPYYKAAGHRNPAPAGPNAAVAENRAALAVGGLISVLCTLSPPDRAVIVCTHSNYRVAELGRGMLPLLRNPGLQLAGSGLLQKASLQQPTSPQLRTGDCLALLATDAEAAQQDVRELEVNARVKRLYEALHVAKGWFGTLLQLRQLLCASDAQLRSWSKAANGDRFGAGVTSSSRPGAVSSAKADGGGDGDGGDGSCCAGKYLQTMLQQLITRMRQHADVLLADLPSAAWQQQQQQPLPLQTPIATSSASVSAGGGAPDTDTAAESEGSNGVRFSNMSSSSSRGETGSRVAAAAASGLALMEELLDSGATVAWVLDMLSPEQVQEAVLLHGSADHGSSAAAAGSGGGGGLDGGGSDGRSAVDKPVHPLVVAMRRLLESLEACRGLPNFRLRNVYQDQNRSKLATALSAIWGPEGWMSVVPELRVLLVQQQPNLPPAEDICDEQHQPWNSTELSRSSSGCQGGTPPRHNPSHHHHSANNDSRKQPGSSFSCNRLQRLLGRLSELAAVLESHVPEGAWVGLAPGTPAARLEQASRSGRALLMALAAACGDASTVLSHLDEVAVRRALMRLQRQAKQQQQQQHQQPAILRGTSSSGGGMAMTVNVAGAACAALPLANTQKIEATAGSANDGCHGGGGGDDGGDDGDDGCDPLAAAFRYHLGRVVEALGRLEGQLDMRSIAPEDAITMFCLYHSRLLICTASGLGKEDLQRARQLRAAAAAGSGAGAGGNSGPGTFASACLVDGATQVTDVQLAPLLLDTQPDGVAAAAAAAAVGSGGSGGGGASGGGSLSAPRLLVLVGDPPGRGGERFLRPRVLSAMSWSRGYGWSVFETLEWRGWPVWDLLPAAIAAAPPAGGRPKPQPAAAPRRPQSGGPSGKRASSPPPAARGASAAPFSSSLCSLSAWPTVVMAAAKPQPAAPTAVGAAAGSEADVAVAVAAGRAAVGSVVAPQPQQATAAPKTWAAAAVTTSAGVAAANATAPPTSSRRSMAAGGSNRTRAAEAAPGAKAVVAGSVPSAAVVRQQQPTASGRPAAATVKSWAAVARQR